MAAEYGKPQALTWNMGTTGNTLSRVELEDKALRLAAYRGGATEDEMRRLIAQVWAMETLPVVQDLLPAAPV